MKKSIIIIGLFFFLIVVNAYSVFSQSEEFHLNEYEKLGNKFDSSVIILKQEYVLYDTVYNRTYPLPEKSYFGKAYYTAIYIDSLLWTDTKLFSPELGDTNYVFYNQRYGFVPKLTHLLYRPIYANHFDTLKFSVHNHGEYADSVLAEHDILLLKPENLILKPLHIQFATTDTSGLAYIIYTHEHISLNDTAQLLIDIFPAKPDFEKNARIENQPAVRNVVGGFYILNAENEVNNDIIVAGYIRRFMLRFWHVKVLPQLTMKEHIYEEVIRSNAEENSNEKKKKEKIKKKKRLP